MRFEFGRGHRGFDGIASVDHRPAVGVPRHWREKGFAPEMMEAAGLRSETKKGYPPTRWRLDEVSVTERLKGMIGPVAMGEDGIVRVRRERSPRGIAARDGHHEIGRASCRERV